MRNSLTRCIAAFTLCTSLVIAAEDSSQTKGKKEGTSDSQNNTDKDVMLYRRIFKQKRAQQMFAADNILQLEDYAKTYKMVELVLDKLFKVLQDAKIKLMESGYLPGGDFPKEQKQLDALANVLENTAFFGDILLRFPDITYKIYSRSKEWHLLAKWSISFSNETRIYDEMDTTLLNLMAQELELVPRDPNYINPYRVQEKLKQKAKEAFTSQKQSSRKQKKEKQNKKRGPRLSGHTEL